MARGPKKHLKRLNAPSHWMLSKMGGIWAPRPSTGPHKLRECLPVCLILRNRLKYALTRREVLLISARKLVKVDGKIRTDQNYPTGFQDVVTIDKTAENFRLLYDTKGRFVLHRISNDEAQYKLCRVKQASKAKKATMGRNPLATKQAAAIPSLPHTMAALSDILTPLSGLTTPSRSIWRLERRSDTSSLTWATCAWSPVERTLAALVF